MEKILKSKLRAILCFILVLFAIVSCATSTGANLITLAWDANTEAELSGYRIYTGTTQGIYSLKAEIPLASLPDPQNPTATVDISYETYLVATAYSESDESGYSNEIFYTLDDPVPPNPATNLYVEYEEVDVMAQIFTEDFNWSGTLASDENWAELNTATTDVYRCANYLYAGLNEAYKTYYGIYQTPVDTLGRFCMLH